MNRQHPNELRDRIVAVGNDITERKITEQTLVRQKALLSGIARIFHEALTCETEEELGEVCVRVAEEITESRFGFIGEIKGQHLEDIAVSNPGWDACAELDPHGQRKPPGKFELHGIYGRVLLDGKGFFTNDPTHHPDRVGLPVGHPPLESFLGAPLIHEGRTIGMIALANRPGGYTPSEQESVEALTQVIVEAFMRKRAEQAVQESEERFHRLFEDDLTGDFLCTPEGQILLCNPAFATMFGFSSPDEAIGTSFLDLCVDLSERESMLESLKQQGKICRYEAWRKRRDGELIYVVENIVGHFSDRGELFEMQGYIFDDTERKQAEIALQEAHDRAVWLGRFPEENPNPVLRVSAEGVLLYCNPATAKSHGWNCETGRIIQKELLPLVGQALAEQREVQEEVELDRRIYNVWVVPIRKEGYVNVYGRDITAHKWAELERERLLGEVQAEREKLSALVNSIQDEIWFADTEKHFTLANPMARTEFALGSGEVVNVEELAGSLKVLRPDGSLRPIEEAPPLRALKGEVVTNLEEMIQTPSKGELRYRQVSSAPVRDGGGNLIGSVSVVRDITERKRMEEELRRSRDELELRVRERTDELELRNRELQDFAFVASHDLNEPLRKIRAFADMVTKRLADFKDEASKDYLKRMQKAAGRMQTLLNSLLSYSRVTTKAEPMKKTDLRRSVKDALSNLEILIGEKNADVEIGDLPTIKADVVQMTQLFQNLIGNALKFHREREAPHVKIHSKEVGDAYEIYVEDNGIGFDEKYLDKIFQPFQRLHGRSSKYEGVGMGLAICMKIVARHGGKITAKSQVDKGSTFVVTLPANRKA
jgi:PAS domain S-box-containing protein